MTRYLVIHVRAHDGRYHGAGDELPSPFRLFQALVAGAGISGPLNQQAKEALTWLESLDAPIIASPRMTRGQKFTMFMPNNDLDKFGGDVRMIAKTRGARKVWRPRHFDPEVPWIYAWPFAENGDTNANTICALSEKIYQLGRGVDMAWAWGEVLDESGLEQMLLKYNGLVQRPSAGDGLRLACPAQGSLASLQSRYQACRFRIENGRRVFAQPPKPVYRLLSYDSPPARSLFELRSDEASEQRLARPLAAASALVVQARDAAKERLKAALPERSEEIERYFVGRKPDGSNAAPPASRVRIIPLPSIGHVHADREIRRVLVEVPPTCPLRADDVSWAFSGLNLADETTGEGQAVLTRTGDESFLHHYGLLEKGRYRVWRTVTPAALPEDARRRRIEPARQREEAKAGNERAQEAFRAAAAVRQALRHAGVEAGVETIRVQREPFEGKGARAEAFADGTRFPKERLWHVEIRFARPVTGPLVIGDGRFLGLGLMAPVSGTVAGLHAFAVRDGLAEKPDPLEIARALRRAVMARVQAAVNTDELAPFFSGHEEDGAPLRRSRSSHLAFAFDPTSKRLLVIAPHLIERRAPTAEECDHLRELDVALEGFSELRAGRAGRLTLAPSFADAGDDDPLFGPSQYWESVTPYVVTRHAKKAGAAETLEADVRAECRRLGLPDPGIESSNLRGVPNSGLTGDVRLTFGRAIRGPILLGRTRYLGGGIFRSCAGQNACQESAAMNVRPDEPR